MNLLQYAKNNQLRVLVKPNARKTEVLGFDEARGAVRIAIAAPAEANKANVELMKFVSKISGKTVRISSGIKSKAKTLRFE